MNFLAKKDTRTEFMSGALWQFFLWYFYLLLCQVSNFRQFFRLSFLVAGVLGLCVGGVSMMASYAATMLTASLWFPIAGAAIVTANAVGVKLSEVSHSKIREIVEKECIERIRKSDFSHLGQVLQDISENTDISLMALHRILSSGSLWEISEFGVSVQENSTVVEFSFTVTDLTTNASRRISKRYSEFYQFYSNLGKSNTPKLFTYFFLKRKNSPRKNLCFPTSRQKHGSL